MRSPRCLAAFPVAALLVLAPACTSDAPPPAVPAAPSPAAAAPTTPTAAPTTPAAAPTATAAPPVAAAASAAQAKTSGKAQAEWGQARYAAVCSDCHGDQGEGGAKSPALIGTNVLPLNPPPTARRRNVPFRTADDVARFVQRSMPPKRAGSLPLDEAYAIVAFLLREQGLDVSGAPLDEKTAPAVAIH